jgi:hypothetical protein
MARQVNGRRRTVRAGGFGRPARERLTSAEQRMRELQLAQEDAKKKFPVLEQKLDAIRDGIREARSTGKRFAYKVPLRKLYELAYGWHEKGKLKSRIGDVANLRAIPGRAHANDFSVLVRAVLDGDADRRTVSRWSVALNDAIEKEVAPEDLIEHL